MRNVLRFLPVFVSPLLLVLALALVLARVQQLGPTIEALGLVFAIGLGGAIAIVVAHELMHRGSWLEQRLAEVLMASTSYTHFCVEYERVRPEHSWNASHLVSNRMLLSLARHSDHHAFVQRPYSELRHWEGAPQLPYGDATMVLLALVPPLWFRLMNDRVGRWNETLGA